MFTLKVDQELMLQSFQKQDSIRLYQLIEENRDHLRKWLPWVDHLRTRNHAESIISHWHQQFAEGNALNLGVIYRGKLVGSIGLHQIDWQNKFTSVGYFLAKKAEGRGMMTRIVRAMLQYIFIDLGLNRVEIRCGVNNKKSRAIPERLGFVLEGRIREGENLSGNFHDLFLYSMLAHDWVKCKSNNIF